MASIEEEMRQSRQAAEDITRPKPSTSEEYLQAKRDSVRNSVLERSRKENFHIRPVMGRDQYGNPLYYNENTGEPAWACLYSASGLYGKNHRVAGNKAFHSNPEKYGFKMVDVSEVLPGDIVQYGIYGWGGEWVPTHGMIYDHTDENGMARFNYTSGDPTIEDGQPDAMRRSGIYDRESPYLTKDGLYRVYRFVGTPEDVNQWNLEYRNANRNQVTRVPATPVDGPVQVHHNTEKH